MESQGQRAILELESRQATPIDPPQRGTLCLAMRDRETSGLLETLKTLPPGLTANQSQGYTNEQRYG